MLERQKNGNYMKYCDFNSNFLLIKPIHPHYLTKNDNEGTKNDNKGTFHVRTFK
jgi:hypothetical protein